MTRWQTAIVLGCLCFAASVASATETLSEDANHATENAGFRVGALRNWFFFSFLPEGDEAETLGLETEGYFPLGSYEVKNISYLEVADYPRPIPGNPRAMRLPVLMSTPASMIC